MTALCRRCRLVRTPRPLSFTTILRRPLSSTHPQHQPHSTPIRTRILNGKRLAEKIEADIADTLSRFYAHTRTPTTTKPGLAVVLVGDRRDSARYVETKSTVAMRLQYNRYLYEFPTTITESALIAQIETLNRDVAVDGLLIQLPLPDHIATDTVMGSIDASKDVDGLHPTNMGLLALDSHSVTSRLLPYHCTHRSLRTLIEKKQLMDFPLLNIPCAARACMELLAEYEIDLYGKRVLVLGRSRIVGLPVTLLAMHANATVTSVNCATPIERVKALCQEADVIISAVGKPLMIVRDWVKPGAVVLDVGINFIRQSEYDSKVNDTDSTSCTGSESDSGNEVVSANPADVSAGLKLVGDADYHGLLGHAGSLTPVPGGLGPLTVAMLMENTLINFIRRHAQHIHSSEPC